MLTYATPDDFKAVKQIGNSGTVVVPTSATDLILRDLMSATRYIQRVTRRDFFPWFETRSFPVPHRYLNLRLRRFPTAILELDNDLLEAHVVNNGVNDLTISTEYFLMEPNMYPKSAIHVKFPAYWGGFTGITSHYAEPVLHVTGLWGYADHRYPDEAWIDTGETVPVGGLTSNATTISVTNADRNDAWGNSAFSVPSLLRIEDELLVTTAKATGVVTVTRGVRGSTAAAHVAGTSIKRWRVAEDIRQATLQIARIWRESNASVNNQLGIADSGASSEGSVPGDVLSIVKMYIRDYF